jgi:hypothetical protein
MVDPDALRYLRIAQADLDEAQRMVELSGFRDSSIGFRLQQACEKPSKAGSTPREAWLPSPTTSSP